MKIAPVLLLWTTLLLSGTGDAVRADTFVRNGHIAGPHSEMTITPEQSKKIAAGLKHSILVLIDLTPEQKSTLKKRYGTKAARVSRLKVMKNTEAACSCHHTDLAVSITKDKIEIADNFIGADPKDEENQMKQYQNRQDVQEFLKKQKLLQKN
ncbi:MAG: hypothetical protein K2W95_00105 [Candidatus Obscuribacterales bacterium]|nr:hypothetical protein [Candidatus Obscuribacterales bacterium]